MTDLALPMSLDDAAAWGQPRNIHPNVVMGIFMLAPNLPEQRDPEDIAEFPSDAEVAWTRRHMLDLIAAGLLQPEPSGIYPWGTSTVSAALDN